MDFPIVLVGAKRDLEDSRQVTADEGKLLAEQWEVDWIEVSGATGENSDVPFFNLVRCIDR